MPIVIGVLAGFTLGLLRAILRARRKGRKAAKASTHEFALRGSIF